MGCGANQPISSPSKQQQHQTSPQSQLPIFIQNEQLRRIEDLAPKIFNKNDSQNSGRLGMQEYYSAILELYQALNNPPPREQLIWAKQKEHDPDGKGMISEKEFLNIAKEVAGYKGQTSEPIQYQQQQTQSQQIIIQQQPVYYPTQPIKSYQPIPPFSQPIIQQGPMIQPGPMILSGPMMPMIQQEYMMQQGMPLVFQAAPQQCPPSQPLYY